MTVSVSSNFLGASGGARIQSFPVYGFPELSRIQSRDPGHNPKIGPDIPVPYGPCIGNAGSTGVPG